MIDLSGQVALVTGGSRGIGRATALLLARAGADVAITYYSRTADADRTVREIEALGRRGFAWGGDLADPEVVERITSQVEQAFGGLDIFVANAGIWPAEEVRLGSMATERWRQTIAANLDSVFLSARGALRLMRPGGLSASRKDGSERNELSSTSWPFSWTKNGRSLSAVRSRALSSTSLA